jgi:phosphoribosylanthranilate isomerase
MILKICGITNSEDAEAAIEGGANAIGFNFYARSPRYVAPERAAQIASGAGIRRVGVFVNEARARVEKIARIAGLGVAQLHGDETAAEYPGGMSVWKAARVGPGFDFSAFADCPVDAIVLDGAGGELYGGAGKPFDWGLAVGAPRRIVLAGGLDASNVAEAIAIVHPWGVDACSRIETEPGRKDHYKMREFLKAAKAAFEL